MRKQVMIIGICSALTGCGQLGLMPQTEPNAANGQTRPTARPDAIETAVRRPPETARTVEEFDTTTAEERAAAAAPPEPTGETALGSTIVSLGDPARPGFWIETPLVLSTSMGRVVFPDTGQSAQVELIPIDGPATAGSRMSLAAMRLIGVPLTGLAEVRVFSGG